MNGEINNAYIILVGKCERKILLEKYPRRKKDKIKLDLSKIGLENADCNCLSEDWIRRILRVNVIMNFSVP